MQKPVAAWWRSREGEFVVAHKGGITENNLVTRYEISGFDTFTCNGEQNSECMCD